MKKLPIYLIILGLGIGTLAFGAAEGIIVAGGGGNGEHILSFGPNGSLLIVDVSKISGFSWRDPTTIVNPTELHLVPSFTWSAQPLAVTEIPTTSRDQYNLANSNFVRLVVNVNATGSINSAIGVQFATSTTWFWLDGANTSTSTQPDTVSLASLNVQKTGWFTMPPVANQDVFLRVVGLGGNGVASPQVNVRLQIR